MYIDSTGQAWWNPFSWSNEVKIIVGAAFIIAGLVATVATGGAFLPALLATTKAVSISMAISGGIGFTVGGLTTGNWNGAIEGLKNGLVDGFMWGGIYAGASQTLASATKLLRFRSIDTSKNVNLLFGNRNSMSTTLIRINKAGNQVFYMDVALNFLLHVQYGAGQAMRAHRWVMPLLVYNGTINFLKWH